MGKDLNKKRVSLLNKCFVFAFFVVLFSFGKRDQTFLSERKTKKRKRTLGLLYVISTFKIKHTKGSGELMLPLAFCVSLIKDSE